MLQPFTGSWRTGQEHLSARVGNFHQHRKPGCKRSWALLGATLVVLLRALAQSGCKFTDTCTGMSRNVAPAVTGHRHRNGCSPSAFWQAGKSTAPISTAQSCLSTALTLNSSPAGSGESPPGAVLSSLPTTALCRQSPGNIFKSQDILKLFS